MIDEDKVKFNIQLRERTLTMAVNVYYMLQLKKSTSLNRSIIQQLIRSSSSVAANCRAALRARSDAEFYSKICTVVEECDETQFWFEYMIRLRLVTDQETKQIRDEVDQLVKIFTSIKKKMKEKTRQI